MAITQRPPLVRPRHVVIGGVCGALAVHLDRSERFIRWTFVALTFCGGAGVLLYLWLWAFIPIDAPLDESFGEPTGAPFGQDFAPAFGQTVEREPGAPRGATLDPAISPVIDPARNPARNPAINQAMNSAITTAINPARSPAVGAPRGPVMGAAFGTPTDQPIFPPPVAPDPSAVRRGAPVSALLVIVAAVAAVVALFTLGFGEGRATVSLVTVTAASGAAVAWSLVFDRRDPGRSHRYGIGIRVASAVLPVLVGSVALGTRPSAVNAILGVAMVVLGVAVLVAPRVVTLWTDLMAERAARVRQEQRAEIAAHLHDSVLQTLALIQNRAGASTEVARIARAQERELRAWLFAGDEPAIADLATELREDAAAIELDYPVRIEVVAAGETVERPSGALVAATREAMLNAARHAGGEVSVYLETSAASIDVFVRDRGPGVDLDALPADRLGIRESIIGRMTRAGGTAVVGQGSGGSGTEVHLHLEAQHD